MHEWRLAAERGDIEAEYFMGLAHELGRGTKRDLSVARQWYDRAKSRMDAQKALKRIAAAERFNGNARPTVASILIMIAATLLE